MTSITWDQLPQLAIDMMGSAGSYIDEFDFYLINGREYVAYYGGAYFASWNGSEWK